MDQRESCRASHAGHRRAAALALVMLAAAAWQSRSDPDRRDDGPGRAEAASASTENGSRLYRERCSSCHGPDGRSKGTPASQVPVLAQPDVFDCAGDDYYRRLVAGGHGETARPGAQGQGRPSRAEIDDLVAFLWTWTAPGARWEDVRGAKGDTGRGGAVYAGLCAGCHGVSGQGGIGSRLDAPSFLAAATDEFLAATIVRGRPGTAMRAWSQLDAATVADLIAFLRSLAPSGAPAALPEIPLGGGDAEAGRAAYEETCATCHGADGNEVLTAQLSNPAFLRAASDSFLAATIARGREGTDMPAHLDPADPLLAPERVRDVIAFLRRWQEPATWRAPVRGVEISEKTVAAGAEHFARFCGSCHGPEGKGRKDGVPGSPYFAPSLVDPRFLAAAADGFLLATIASGRSATPMRPFGIGAGGIAELEPAVLAEIVAWLRSQEKAGAAEGR